ncbi:MAG: spore germination protein [Bacillota bacterium]|nr:spore germination protein [Bacillota bacterium]
MKPLSIILNKLLSLLPRKSKKNNGEKKDKKGLAVDYRDISQREADFKKTPLGASLENNIRILEELTGGSFDLNIKRSLSGPKEVDSAVVYFDGMVEKVAVEELLRIVKIDTFKTGIGGVKKNEIYETVKRRLITKDLKEAEDLESLYEGISLGDTALLFDGTAKAILCETKGWDYRSIMEPEAETTIRGPREGFIENIRVNTSLIRRRIRSPNLWIESINIGSLSKTEVAYAYIKGLAGEEILEEVRSRLERIDIDSVLESGVIEEFIHDAPYSLFPTIFRTERPDIIASGILEGRVAIFTSGTPIVLMVPADFAMFLHAPDDYNELFPIGTFIRILRLAAFLFSIFLPGLYVSVINFHPELIPTSLLLTIQTTREGVPFPVLGEILLMELAFEFLREAGLRLPKAIGPAISIVGALILGEAAIRAGIVSPGVVIIVAFTAIASFTAPTFSIAISARILRFFMIILGGAFGLLGIQLGFLLMLINLVSLRSFGYPYMAPYGPFILQDMKDNIIRAPWWLQGLRPKLLGFREPRRQRPSQQARPRKSSQSPKKGTEGR